MQVDKEVRYHSMVWFSDDEGKTWDKGRQIGDPGFWSWRAQWHRVHDGLLWVSYYSSHEEKTCIYLAKVEV